MLELSNITRRVGGETWLSDISLTLKPGAVNVLLGPTRAGKTSLMRIMAGLDRPDAGDIRVNGRSVLGEPVQGRNIAMVYQQFINYPGLTVYENIASPLRLMRVDRAEIDRRVKRAADLLRLTPLLARKPLELSGGQQQRCALARALVKGASLVLLDEPLANLDYKLREELRAELPKVFAETEAVFVYATTEPHEALLLGGNTAALSQGRLAQFGPTIEVYGNPADLTTAATFSDPPLNLLAVSKQGGQFRHASGFTLPAGAHGAVPDGPCTIGCRPHHLGPHGGGAALSARVIGTEITGSESFVHLDVGGARWIALLHGVHNHPAGEALTVHLDPDRLLVFAADGRLVSSPRIARAA